MCSDFINLMGSCYIDNWFNILSFTWLVMIPALFVGFFLAMISYLFKK